jgi:hypothetical protein
VCSSMMQGCRCRPLAPGRTDTTNRWRSPVISSGARAAAFQRSPGDGKWRKQCGSTSRSSGRCQLASGMDDGDESAWRRCARPATLVAARGGTTAGREAWGGGCSRGTRPRA